jgi:HEAT repeat protein
MDVLLAVVLLAAAAYLVATRYTSTRVDWYLGDIGNDPSDWETRQALHEMGDTAIPRIEEELQSTDPNSRLTAVFAVSAIDGAGAERILATAAGDVDAVVAANAVGACVTRADAATAAAMASALDDARFPVRRAARRAVVRRAGGGLSWALGAKAKGG